MGNVRSGPGNCDYAGGVPDVYQPVFPERRTGSIYVAGEGAESSLHFQISEINRTVGTNGFLRRLFYLDIGGVNRNPLLEKILRNAHLYEKLESARLNVPRAKYYHLEAELQELERALKNE